MSDLSTFASAAAARSEILTDPGSALQGIENGDGNDITNRIIDSGAGSDGYWVRYADATQICWHTFTITLSSSALGDYNWFYQREFTGSNIPFVSLFLSLSSSDWDSGNNRYKVSTCGFVHRDYDNAILRIASHENSSFNTNDVRNCIGMAIGRWK